MTSAPYASVLIVGAGQGLSASLTRLFRNEGLAVAIAARRLEVLLHDETCPVP